jgi:hypothetical protein
MGYYGMIYLETYLEKVVYNGVIMSNMGNTGLSTLSIGMLTITFSNLNSIIQNGDVNKN